MKAPRPSLLARTSLVACLVSGLLAGCFNGSSSSDAGVEPPPAPEPSPNIFESSGVAENDQYRASLTVEPFGMQVRETNEYVLALDEQASVYRSLSSAWSLRVER